MHSFPLSIDDRRLAPPAPSKPALVLPRALILGACAGLLLGLAPASNAANAGPQRQTLRGVVPGAVGGLQAKDRLAPDKRLRLAISLPLRNQDALHALLRDLYDPTSQNYRQWLTPQQFTERFGPSEQDYQALMNFAKANGLTITVTHPNRVVLDVEGAVSDVEAAFHVSLRVYAHAKEARTFYAPDAEPSLDLAVPVLSISGLDNYWLARPRSKLRMSTKAANKPLDTTPALGSGTNGTYRGYDFRAAYAPGVTQTGSGQSVGLLQFDGFYANDITIYETEAGLPNVPLTVVPIDGGVASPGGDNAEVCLDIETAIAMAPGLSRVYVYEAPNPSPWVDLLSRMANDNLSKQLSCSWGGGPPDAAAEVIFQQMAAQGQSFFNAAGDSDAFCASTAISFPAESPNITQVGGTTLTTAGPVGAYVSERVWNWGGGTGTGGGISVSYAIPTWQQGIDMVANHGSTTMRNIPDVALTADNVYVRYNNGSWGNFGGTSCAAPLWAGFMALVNERAIANGRPTVGFLNPAISVIGKGAGYNDSFYDTTVGANNNSCQPTLFPAVAGFDLCTGWGTPKGAALIDALAGPADSLLVIPHTGFYSVGSPGGPFDVTSRAYVLTNSGTSALSWTLSITSSWLSASSASGSLTPGGPASAVTIGLATAANSLASGTYATTAWFTNLSDGVGQGRGFTLKVLGAPEILAQPANLTTRFGAAATFSVIATGAPPVSYSWRRNGTPIAGATQSSYTTNNVQVADTGAQFSCLLSNAYGTLLSSNATLVVSPSLILNGGFETGDFTGWEGDKNGGVVNTVASFVHSGAYGASFGTVGTLGTLAQSLPTVVGTPYLISLWFRNPDGSSPNEFRLTWNGTTLYDAVNIPFTGWTNLQLAVTATTTTSTLELGFRHDPYWLGVDDVSVIPLSGAPTIVAQPASQTVAVGDSASFSVSAIGAPPLSYFWRRNGSFIPGATASSYTTNNVQLPGSGSQFSCLVSNADGTVLSSNAVLTVSEIPVPVFLSGNYLYLPIHTNGQFLVDVTGARFNPAGTGGATGVDFWYPGTPVYNYSVGVEGINYLNGNFSSLTLANLSSGGLQHAVLDGMVGPGLRFTRDISFAPNDKVIRIVDTLQNTGAVALNNVITFDTTDPDQDYSAPLSTYYTSNDVVSVNGPDDLVVATGPSTQLSLGFGSDSGLQVASAVGFNNTDGYGYLTVVDPNGASADIDINLAQNYGSLPAGQSRSVVWFMVFGTNKAEVINLFGGTNTPPALGCEPQNVVTNPGGSATFCVCASGSPPLSYFWRRNGTIIPGATGSCYTTNNVQEADSGSQFSCLVSNAFGTLASSNATLIVSPGLDHFDWSAVASPHYVNNPFGVTVTAKDPFGATVTSFTGTVTLSASVPGAGTTNTVLNGLSPSGSYSGGAFTDGYAFTPNVNLLVTHIRYYYGTKVSIWTDAGVLVASQTVISTPGTWQETPLATPVTLTAGTRYRMGIYYPAGATFYWNSSRPATFANGTIDAGYYGSGDGFPVNDWGTFTSLVDIRYTVGGGAAVPISPVVSGNFVGGIWTGNLTVLQAASNIVLQADDSYGHNGSSNPFNAVNGSLSNLTLGISLGGDAAETAALAGTLTNLGFLVRAVTNGQWAGLNVVVVQPGCNPDTFGPTLSQISNGVSVIQIGDWGSDWTPNAWSSVADSTPLTVGVNAAHPITAGLPASWSTYGFWHYWSGFDYYGWSTDTALTSLVSLTAPASQARLLVANAMGLGKAVYIGWNVYGPDASPSDVSLLRNAILWAAVAATNTNPVITAQPQNVIASPGASATFCVSATGAPPLSYFWRRDGASIPGATASCYTTNNVQPADSGALFSCLVSNAYGTALSSDALLTVAPTNAHMRVAIYAAEGTLSWDLDVKTNIVATGLFGDADVDVYDIYSSTNPTLAQLHQYAAIITWSDGAYSDNTGLGNVLADYVDAGGGVVVGAYAWTTGSGGIAGRIVSYLPMTQGATASDASHLTMLKDAPAHPVLQGVNTFDGGAYSRRHTISPAAGATLIAHWTDGLPLIAANNPSNGRIVGLNFRPTSTAVNTYGWQLGTDGGRILANALLWAGGGATNNLAPFITSQPTNQVLFAGGTATFGVGAGGTAPLSYFWRRNGALIPGATVLSYTTNNVQLADSGAQFSCLVSNAYGAVTSSIATLTVLTTNIVDHFAWSSIGATQYAGVPFPATISALTASGTVASSFNGSVSVSAAGAGGAEYLHVDFESGLQGFTINNNYGSSNGLWHVSTGRASNPGHSPTHSLYYGQHEGPTGGGDYNVTNFANGGVVVSAPIILPASAAPISLSFNYLTAVEAGTTYDQAVVEVSTNNGVSYQPVSTKGVADGITNITDGLWVSNVVNLSSFAGSTIRLRFRFDTGDSIANSTEGWYLDDIVIRGGGAGTAVPVTPTTVACSNGIWSGNLAVLQAANNVMLTASDGTHSGLSNPFQVISNTALRFIVGTNIGSQFSHVFVPVRVTGFTNISSFQFSLHWNPAIASFVNAEAFGLPGLGAANFGASLTNTGTLTVSWDDPDGLSKSLADGSTVFGIRFRAIGAPGTVTALPIDGNPTPIEAVNGQLALVSVETVPGQLSVALWATISGAVTHYGSALPVAGVAVSATIGTNLSVLTATNGSYSLALNYGSNYVVTPSKSGDALPANGVTTVDISLIRRHVLGSVPDPLEGPHAFLAGDVNCSGTVSTLDITLMRRLILGTTNTLPCGLWRFVPASYEFPDPLNPWSAPGSLAYLYLSTDWTNQNYVAIKLGDVNHSWAPNLLPGPIVAPLSAPAVSLQASRHFAQPGETVTAKVQGSGLSRLTSVQLTLEWDPAVLRYLGTGHYGIPDLSAANFWTGLAASGKLALSWDETAANGVTLPDGTVLFTVSFAAIGPMGSASTVALADSMAPREIGLAFAPAALRTVNGQVSLVNAGSLKLGAVSYGSGMFSVSVPTLNGKQYVLEFSDSVSGGKWTALPVVPGDGTMVTLSDSQAPSQRRFYRVRVQ
jgi:hypothetical protein